MKRKKKLTKNLIYEIKKVLTKPSIDPRGKNVMYEVPLIQLFEDSANVTQKEFGNWKNYLTFTSYPAVFLDSPSLCLLPKSIQVCLVIIFLLH